MRYGVPDAGQNARLLIPGTGSLPLLLPRGGSNHDGTTFLSYRLDDEGIDDTRNTANNGLPL